MIKKKKKCRISFGTCFYACFFPFYLKKPKNVSHLLSELPRKKRLMFLCRVEVEVSFSALYSNVLVAFATVKTTGPHTQDCVVTLSSIPVSISYFPLHCQTFSPNSAIRTSLSRPWSTKAGALLMAVCLNCNTLKCNCYITAFDFWQSLSVNSGFG